MLVGLFLRHYKTYKKINFIPISTGPSFTAYMGANGVGKSSILDALDKFFNGGEWSINLQARSDGGISGDDKVPFIMPIFLIERSLLESSAEVELLSSYLWNTDYKTVDAISEFYTLRDNLTKKGFSEQSHYLIAIGKQYPKNGVFLGSFGTDPELKIMLEGVGVSEKDLTILLQKILNIYAYFYIPVEADASAYSALESKHVLKLLDENIRGAIEYSIGSSTVAAINGSLGNFIDDISNSLKEYEYKGSYKNKLTMNDLIEKVFEAYFSIKILHGKRDGTSLPIRDMSAGEKRRALIDLAYSLLARSKARGHTVLLAIDEPDASLHTSACHDQFARLAEIPQLTIPQTQVLITTHWYGFLPILQEGIAHAMQNTNGKIEFHSFDLYNYHEQIKQKIKSQSSAVALDVELKSHNDLIQAIVSSIIRQNGYNWILCEGLSDKIYLEYYLSSLVKSHNLRIIPLGGFKEVRRAYEYLIKPLNDTAYSPTGRVLCLVDTDEQLPSVTTYNDAKYIDFKRIIYNSKENECILVDMQNEKRSPATEIEHALDPKNFLRTVKILDDSPSVLALREIVKNEKYNDSSKSTYGYLDLSPSLNERMMSEYFDIDDNKVRFANAYTQDPWHVTPRWIEEIKLIFNPPQKKGKK
ncbi:AAA family ATPase [Janthinobacterium sp. EB271-G4-7A]|uniref:AAA family ATPase n=1 Tax=Janthinobacterium sp. EB271-G4-7A TaxID=2775056 RepID=UPI001E600822|nr:AAA family ATPase [Janthinobacterium sp. EB271-G4-7A]MCC7699058.1 AAA family ATPase [Janthinobacterium sp. EB271-G4-7A]